jgi:phospholipase/carboxylesterase/glyoxalase family protein
MNPSTIDLGFIHQFVRGAEGGDGVGLLLLHGTGGDESSLIPLAGPIAPGAAILSPRGRVSENGMPRFFRRLAEGVFDLDDLRVQTAALARFIESAAQKYSMQPDRVIAVGYSNGANIASSVMLSRPDVLRAAVLFRPMVPFVPQSMPDLSGGKVLVGAGRRDPIASQPETGRLVEILKTAGADVTVHWYRGGHELSQDDVEAAASWVSAWRAAF